VARPKKTGVVPCAVPGCALFYWARGLCSGHYAQWFWFGKTWGLAWLPRRQQTGCREEGCGRPIRSGKGGRCFTHWRRRREGRKDWQRIRDYRRGGGPLSAVRRGPGRPEITEAPHEPTPRSTPLLLPRSVECPKWILDIRTEACRAERDRGCWCERGGMLAELEAGGAGREAA